MQVARRILRSDADAEDAAQEALARAWRQRASCREPDRYMAWVAQIARREALRLTQVRTSEEFDESAHGAGLDDLDAVLRRLDVDSALDELASEERSLIVLRYTRDLTYREVADELGLPVGTAKVRLHRLRARLRARLTGTNAS